MRFLLFAHPIYRLAPVFRSHFHFLDADPTFTSLTLPLPRPHPTLVPKVMILIRINWASQIVRFVEKSGKDGKRKFAAHLGKWGLGNLERLKENPSGPSSWIMFSFSYLDFVASKFYSLERCKKVKTYNLNQIIFYINNLIAKLLTSYLFILKWGFLRSRCSKR